ncbi:MAG: pentapeptide repeat-containing protein [Nostoc indistinguendum CM1-VF10]|jgi:uncharacterized protein YjbI with pentapeptide repeats|nr:pentapeptide repeat-containing protein [Nostoc indistinguendum CM1-VF10]
MNNILLTSNSFLKKIVFQVHFIQQKFNFTRYYSPKERLRVAIEQLANNTIETNLAVIDDLEQISHEYQQYQWLTIDILTAFVRANSPCMPQEKITSNSTVKIRTDIQAALTVIARRNTNKDLENEQIDLSHTDMRGVNLKGANLEQANLYQVNLSGANLRKANLAGAILSAANLEGADLTGANLKGAILSAANLKGANLSGTSLHQANLYLARLYEAILDGVILNGANLREAKFSQ